MFLVLYGLSVVLVMEILYVSRPRITVVNIETHLKVKVRRPKIILHKRRQVRYTKMSLVYIGLYSCVRVNFETRNSKTSKRCLNIDCHR